MLQFSSSPYIASFNGASMSKANSVLFCEMSRQFSFCHSMAHFLNYLVGEFRGQSPILSGRDPFQITKMIVYFYAVLMIDLIRSIRRVADKSKRNKLVNTIPLNEESGFSAVTSVEASAYIPTLFKVRSSEPASFYVADSAVTRDFVKVFPPRYRTPSFSVGHSDRSLAEAT